ncbi:MAG: putative DNA-binding domain-containing protein [Gammaproteobacteria bacterium]|nr:putative DNA-binding domain-containing protein [Gammaproteobacteria bacterium]
MSPEQQSDLPAFQQQQLAFTAHIRNPQQEPRPGGIPARRMGVYTELFFNNINEQFSNNFPVLRRICSDEHWLAMMRDFMVRHRSTTPLFTQVGLEFIDYLQNERETQADDWPFMVELAHYEYVELAVAISPADEGLGEFDPNGDLIEGIPLLGPTAWNLTYRWPVQMIGPDYLPDVPPEQPTHLVVYRDRLDQVHFLQINAVTQRLLQLLKEDASLTGLDAMRTIAVELAHSDPDAVIAAGRELLDDLRQRNVILGTRT